MKALNCLTVPILFFLLLGCKKKESPLAFPYNYIAKMGNQRHWLGTNAGNFLREINDSTWTSSPFSYTLNYTFALSVSGEHVTSSYFGEESNAGGDFTYTSFDSVTQCLNFSTNHMSALYYYYLADSIVITGEYGGIHGTDNVVLSSQKY